MSMTKPNANRQCSSIVADGLPGPSPPKQILQRPPRRLSRIRIPRLIRILAILKIVTEVRAHFIFHLLRHRFAAVARDAGIVEDAGFADVQFGAAVRTFGQAGDAATGGDQQVVDGGSAFPALRLCAHDPALRPVCRTWFRQNIRPGIVVSAIRAYGRALRHSGACRNPYI